MIALSLCVVLLYQSPLLLRYKDKIFLHNEVGLENVVIGMFVVGAAKEVRSREEQTLVSQVLNADLA